MKLPPKIVIKNPTSSAGKEDLNEEGPHEAREVKWSIEEKVGAEGQERR